MRVWFRAVLAACLFFATVSARRAPVASAADSGPAQGPREIYQALNALRVDSSQVYPVSELRLRRDAVNLTFSDGTIGFLNAYDGQVTGVVFSGHGHVSAIPHDPAEKRSLAHFLGIPLLDRNFSSAYLRFDDGSAKEIRDQLQHSQAQPLNQPDFANGWNRTLANLNPNQSLRILMDWKTEETTPFFYAGLVDDELGAFDLLVDGRRTDTVRIGQTRWTGGNPYYDVWTSFAGTSLPPPPPPAFAPVSYAVDTTIEPDRALDGNATIELQAKREGEHGIALELSRFLMVQSVQDADGHALDFLQNDALSTNQLAEQGNDIMLLFLQEAPHLGQTFKIHIAYHGSVISDAGNGVYYVGDRGSWYPHIGGMSNFVPFDATFHWPRRLHLVATGEKVEEHEDGDWSVGHWRSDGATPISGFNLGDYVVENVETVDGVRIELAANSELENAIAARIPPEADASTASIAPPPPTRGPRRPVVIFDDGPPRPAAGLLKELGSGIASAIRVEQQWMGPFPFRRLVVSQIPGTLGQGWPGLLYLPTLSFLPSATQQRAGLTGNEQEALNEIVPYHEVAHQWWGNVVGWDNYHDQWLNEGLANYVALAGADSEKPNEHLLIHWLDRYRKELTSRVSGQDFTVDESGPLVHGFRLSSSFEPDGYEKIIYGKGAWVFHMLRMMMQDPVSKKPDDRFIGLLRALLESYRYRALTTEDLQKAVEHIMTPTMALEGGHSMDWFFEEFVRSTGIPAYELEFTTRSGAKGFLVRGKLIQKDVPEDFVLRVPIYAQGKGSKPSLLGYVVTSGEETSFQFTTAMRPQRLLVDPQMTLLCLPPSSTSPAPE